MKSHLITLAIATIFGFFLSRIGFSSWDEVHQMFTFADLRLVLAFGMAVVLLSIGWVVVRRVRKDDPDFSRRPIHKGSLVGGIFSSATFPTGQAYAADISGREDRTAAMAVIGAAFGLGIICGPGIGAGVASLFDDLLAPVWLSASVAALNALFVATSLPEPTRRTTREVPRASGAIAAPCPTSSRSSPSACANTGCNVSASSGSSKR